MNNRYGIKYDFNENTGSLGMVVEEELLDDSSNPVASWVLKGALLDIFYPVGSYYETSNASFNPNTAWGGTWVEDTKGRVTVAKSDSGTFANVGAEGGSEDVTLTLNQIPEHGHNVHTWNNNQSAADAKVYDASATSNTISKLTTGGFRFNGNQGEGNGWISSGFRTSDGRIGAESGAGDVSGMTSKKGGSKSHTNLQPYKVVKRWHRTA